MNSNPENKKHDKDFNQIRLVPTREITWKIRNFKSLPKTNDYSLDSPAFDFENATWCLRLYTCVEDSQIGFMIVRLCSRVPRHRLHYNLVWPDEHHGNHSMKSDFDENHNEDGDMCFVEPYVFTRYTSDIDQTKTLTLTCQISCYGSPVVDGFSQTEQDTKIADIGDFCQHFQNLLLNGQDHDLVLKVRDKELRAHQNILRARSTVFDSMLSHGTLEKNGGAIDIPDCDPGAFEQFLLYLYGGGVRTLDADNMLELYYVADKYDMGHLKEQCRRFIKNSLTSTNVSDVIQHSLNQNDADLLECATDYFVKHVSVVLRTVEWQSFAKGNIVQANELFIKAADNLEARKNLNPENRKNDENFRQIDLSSTREIKWRIPNFISLPKAADYSLDSPPFGFENATWCLRLYPYFQETHVGFTIVRLSSRVPRHRLRYNLIWPDEYHGYHSVEVDFNEDHWEDGDMSFVELSRSTRYAYDDIAKTEILELVCQISSYGSPVVDVFSQTEQDTGSIGDLRRNFKNLLLNGRDHDLVLKVKDGEFRAHQSILRARSPVLESMLSHDMLEKNSGAIDIPDCDPDAFEQFLLYLYGGEAETLDSDNMLTLYYIADKYDMGHLKEQCHQFIKKSLTSINASDVIQLALDHSDAALLECATDYFLQNVHVVLRTARWQSFVERNPTEANELFIKAAGKLDAENLSKMMK